jgi:hypothetical protein
VLADRNFKGFKYQMPGQSSATLNLDQITVQDVIGYGRQQLSFIKKREDIA